jgi:hypothetical protein
LIRRNSRSRNHLISWDKIDLTAAKPSLPMTETKRTSSQGNEVRCSSVIRFASSLVTRVLYQSFRLLYGGAKFLTRGVSEIREMLRS